MFFWDVVKQCQTAIFYQVRMELNNMSSWAEGQFNNPQLEDERSISQDHFLTWISNSTQFFLWYNRILYLSQQVVINNAILMLLFQSGYPEKQKQ